MVLTNDVELADKMACCAATGITRDPAQMTPRSRRSWYYQQIDLGFNYRMTELQTAFRRYPDGARQYVA